MITSHKYMTLFFNMPSFLGICDDLNIENTILPLCASGTRKAVIWFHEAVSNRPAQG